jgi:hypothetical protein
MEMRNKDKLATSQQKFFDLNEPINIIINQPQQFQQIN